MLKLLVEMKVDGPAPDMLVKRRCWWQFFDVGDIFRHAGDFLMLRIGHQIIKLDTKISKLSPTDFISNIRHQHRCSRLIPIQSKRSIWRRVNGFDWNNGSGSFNFWPLGRQLWIKSFDWVICVRRTVLSPLWTVFFQPQHKIAEKTF